MIVPTDPDQRVTWETNRIGDIGLDATEPVAATRKLRENLEGYAYCFDQSLIPAKIVQVKSKRARG